MSKTCSKCKNPTPREQFYKKSALEDGYRSYCRDCEDRQNAEYRSTLHGRIGQMVYAAKTNSKRRGERGRQSASECTIEVKDLEEQWEKQGGRCYYSGIEMSFTSKDWYASLERLDEDKGYAKDNVVLCCLEFNTPSQWSVDKIVESLELLKLRNETRCRQIEIPSDFFATKQTRGAVRKAGPPTIVDGITYFRCRYCDELKPKDDFYAKRFNKCKRCRNAEKVVSDSTPRGSLMRLINATKQHTKARDANKHSHTRRGELEIDVERLVDIYRQQHGLCYYSGLPLAFGPAGTPWKCSLERIDPFVVYTKDNVRLICQEFNSIDNTVCLKKPGPGQLRLESRQIPVLFEACEGKVRELAVNQQPHVRQLERKQGMDCMLSTTKHGCHTLERPALGSVSSAHRTTIGH
eukprot:jgi/Chrzof1/8015/UNPLg00066.t1